MFDKNLDSHVMVYVSKNNLQKLEGQGYAPVPRYEVRDAVIFHAEVYVKKDSGLVQPAKDIGLSDNPNKLSGVRHKDDSVVLQES